MSMNSDTANAASVIVDRHISRNNGDQLAIRFRDKRYSYHDLAALMNRAGNMMRRLGVGAGDAVPIAVAPSPSLVAGLLGAMKIGAVPVLLPGGASPDALDAVAGRHQPKLLIADAARVAGLAELAKRVTLVVVGEAAAGQRSFLEEMRESASSLTRSPIANGSPALALVTDGEVVIVAHQELAGASSGGPLTMRFEDWNLGAALTRFARGEEEVIGRPD